MNTFRLLEGIGEIDDRFLLEAEDFARPSHRQASARRMLLRAASAAACLAIALTGGLLYLRTAQIKQESTASSENTAADTNEAAPEPRQMVPGDTSQAMGQAPALYSAETAADLPLYEADGFFYREEPDPSVLAQYGLPDTVDESDAGEQVCALENGSVICLYRPMADAAAVRVLRTEDGSLAFLLCTETGSPRTLAELYGLDSAEKVISAAVRHSDGTETALTGQQLAEAAEALCALVPQQPDSSADADSVLTVTVQSGLILTLSYCREDAALQNFSAAYPVGETLQKLLEE